MHRLILPTPFILSLSIFFHILGKFYGGGMMGGYGGGMMGGYGGGMMGGMVYSEMAPPSATVLTIRAKKSDVDDFARGELDFEQFQQTVEIFTLILAFIWGTPVAYLNQKMLRRVAL